MQKYIWLTSLLTGFFTCSIAQKIIPAGWWRASLQREDGRTIDFNVEVQYKKNTPVWFIRNATERIAITTISQKQDSVWMQMPLFESEFRLQYDSNHNTLRGVWIKGTAAGSQVMPVLFTYRQPLRYPAATQRPAHIISGRWATTFIHNSDTLQAIAVFKQNNNRLTGTIITPTGDYRYLEGAVSGDTLQLSTFDGSHAYYFTAAINNDSVITGGIFCSGARYIENWTAVKNARASLPDTLASVYMKAGEERLHFRFPDLDSTMVSIDDDRFRNKVVIVQLMGSWCPNCMDETAFLSDYYSRNKQRGVAMVALAYEYSTDFRRSQKSLRKFQQRFNIQYPMLITGVRVGDTLRTEKTLPQITRIRMFPTTIFIGRDGTVKKIHTGFVGPGTGIYHEAYKKDFYSTVNELLR